MKIKVLGASGAEFPGQNPPGFLLDDSVLMDAGTVGAVLNEDEQWHIRHVLLTHAHLDHIRSIPFLADNIILKNMRHSVTIWSIEPVLKALKDNLLNDTIWPDFTRIPSVEDAVLRLSPVKPGRRFEVNGYSVIAHEVNHTIPAVGFVVEGPHGKRMLYSGDTGPTEALWKEASTPIDCAIIEVSMPNEMEEMALKTGHLTAALLGQELKKMKNIPSRLCITHPKPQYLATIVREVAALGIPRTSLLKSGEIIEV